MEHQRVLQRFILAARTAQNANRPSESLVPSFGFRPGQIADPIVSRNVSSGHQSVFGPVSYIRARSPLPPPAKEPTEVDEEKKSKDADDSHKFLMRKMKTPTDDDGEDSQVCAEFERAERAEFVQMMMLATVQDTKTFRPIIWVLFFILIFLSPAPDNCEKFFNKNVIFSH